MSKIRHTTPINADLWLELEKRMERKSKAINNKTTVTEETLFIADGIEEDHWFIDQIKIDIELRKAEQTFIEKTDEMLKKIYGSLSDDDKKIIDNHIQDGINKSMAEVYRDLSSEDFGLGVYMSEGRYLQKDGTFSSH